MHKPIDLRIQRAQAVRQRLGQHRQRRGSESRPTCRDSALPCRARILADVVATSAIATISRQPPRTSLAVHRVVEVARILAVDRDERQLAQVFAPALRRGRHAAAVRFGLGNRLARKLERQAVRVNRDLGLHARRAHARRARGSRDRAPAPCATAARRAATSTTWPACAPPRCPRGTNTRCADARIVGHHETDAGFVVQASDDLARVALEHFDDRALRPAAIVLAADANSDAVAVHRFEHLARRQEHRRRTIVGQHEAVAVAMPADGADDERGSCSRRQYSSRRLRMISPGCSNSSSCACRRPRAALPSRPIRAASSSKLSGRPGLAQRRHDTGSRPAATASGAACRRLRCFAAISWLFLRRLHLSLPFC